MNGPLEKYQSGKTEKQLLFELALACYQKAAFSRALQYLDDVKTLEGDPGKDEFYFLQALNLKELKKTEQAIIQVSKLVFTTGNKELKSEGLKLFGELLTSFTTKDALERILSLVLNKASTTNHNTLKGQGVELISELTKELKSKDILAKIAKSFLKKDSNEPKPNTLKDLEIIYEMVKEQWKTIERMEQFAETELKKNTKEIKELIIQNKYKEALELCEQATTIHAENIGVLLLKIRAMAEGQIDLEKAKTLFEDSDYGYMSYVENENELKDLLQAIIDENPERGNNYFFAAFAANAAGVNIDLIEKWLEKADALGLQTEDANPEKGLYQLKGDIYKNKDPLFAASSYLEAAKRYYWEGNYEMAGKFFRWSIELNSDLKEAYYYLSDTLFLQSIRTYPPFYDKKILVEALSTWKKGGPPNVQSAAEAWHWFSAARIYEANYLFTKFNFADEYWKSVQNGERALMYDPSNLFFLGQHAKFLRNLGLYQNSNFVLEQAALISKTDTGIEEEKIINLIDTGHYEESWNWLQAKKEQLTSEYPQYYKLWEGYILFYDRKDFTGARTLFSEVIKEAPGNMFAREMKLFIELHGGLFAAAFDAARDILTLYNENDYPKDFFAYTWALLVTGDTEKAIQVMESVEKTAGNYLNQGFSLTPFYLVAGKTQKAAEKLDEYIQQNLKVKDLFVFRDHLQMVSNHLAKGNFGEGLDPNFIQGFTGEQVIKINKRIDELSGTTPNPISEILKEEGDVNNRGSQPLHISTLAIIKARVFTILEQFAEAEAVIRILHDDHNFIKESDKLLENLRTRMADALNVALTGGDFSKGANIIATLGKNMENSGYHQLLASYCHFHTGDTMAATNTIETFLHDPAFIPQVKAFFDDLAGKFYRADDTWQFGLFLKHIFYKEEDPLLQDAWIDFWNKLLNKFQTLSPVTTPVAVDLASNLVPEEAYTDEWEIITKRIPAMRDRISNQYGVMTPGIRIREYGKGLEDDSFFYSLDDVPIILVKVPSDTPDPFDFIIRDLEKVLTNNLALYTDFDYCHNYLTGNLPYIIDGWENETQTMAETIKKDKNYFIQFKKVLHALVSEKFPLSQRARIVNLFVNAPPTCTDTSDFIQHIRENMEDVLWKDYCDARVIQLNEETEKEIELEFDSVGGKKFLAIIPENCQKVLAEIREKVTERETVDPNKDEENENPMVLQVKRSHLRYHIKKLIELEFPRIAVLTEHEMEQINVQHAP